MNAAWVLGLGPTPPWAISLRQLLLKALYGFVVAERYGIGIEPELLTCPALA